MPIGSPEVAGRALLIDTNVLLLLVLGAFDPRLIGRGRLDRFSVNDFNLLRRLISKSPRRLTTPQVLTEVGNLAATMVEARRKSLFFSHFGNDIGLMEERQTPSRELVLNPVFMRLGLTDASIAQCAAEGIVVITDDFPLAGSLRKRGLRVLNFNELRSS